MMPVAVWSNSLTTGCGVGHVQLPWHLQRASISLWRVPRVSKQVFEFSLAKLQHLCPKNTIAEGYYTMVGQD
jgi:hypothetical protein